MTPAADRPGSIDTWPYGLRLLAKDTHNVAPGRSKDDCQLTRAAHEHWGQRSRLHMHNPKHWFFALGLRGSLHLRDCPAAGVYGPGHVVVFSPHDHSELAITDQNGWEILLVTGYGYGLRDLMRSTLGLRTQALRLDNASRVEQILRAALAAAADGGPYVGEICNHFLAILLKTVKQGTMRRNAHTSPALITFARAKAYIDHHFADLHSARDIAEACSINRTYLARLFRTHAHDSPYAYLQRLKMNHAAHCLLTTDDTLQVIATALGYADAFSFSKAFRRQFGISPSVYRSGR
ncbi:MAG: helix-turn-helix transcriptional regulator [Planctomycetota bacterium]